MFYSTQRCDVNVMRLINTTKSQKKPSGQLVIHGLTLCS